MLWRRETRLAQPLGGALLAQRGATARGPAGALQPCERVARLRQLPARVTVGGLLRAEMHGAVVRHPLVERRPMRRRRPGARRAVASTTRSAAWVGGASG